MKGESLAWWVGAAVTGILFAGSGSSLHAQQRDISPVRTQAVDEAQTANWPAGPWRSVPRQDYLELVREIAIQRSRPRPAWIQTARYSARIFLEFTFKTGTPCAISNLGESFLVCTNSRTMENS